LLLRARLHRVGTVLHQFYDLNAAAAFEPDPDFEESWLRVENYEALANMPQLVHVRTLSLGECAILDKHLKPLLASRHLTNLRDLQLTSNRLGDAGARVVAESPRAAGLTHLDLNTNEIGRGARPRPLRTPVPSGTARPGRHAGGGGGRGIAPALRWSVDVVGRSSRSRSSTGPTPTSRRITSASVHFSGDPFAAEVWPHRRTALADRV
jgi:hypothetical protein